MRQLSILDALPGAPARTWTVTVDAPWGWLTVNDHRPHWDIPSVKRAWTAAARTAARAAQLPYGLTEVHITPTIRPGRVRRDPATLAPTITAAVAGLGLTADPVVLSARLGEPLPTGARLVGVLVLTVTEAPT